MMIINIKNQHSQNINKSVEPHQDSLIAKNLQREQYIGVTILLIGLIIMIGFFNQRLEYALIFALTVSAILIVFLLAV
ncbi:MAG: hypothetical protein EAZ87_04260 [Nostocales cyanobacterium]|nr:MAG: hypothetical protein EAZ87_04260 [Nostocales cyanobacterium]